MSRTHRRPLGRSTLGVILASVALVAAACSSSSPSSTSSTSSTLSTTQIPTQTKSEAVAALVPSAIAGTGQITYAMDATYPPDEFISPAGSSTIVGMDADLGVAIAQVMGLKSVLQNVTFDAINPGLQAGKYDVGLSSLTDTLARQQVVDFVNYFQAGESFYVKSGSKASFTSLDSLCGHTVAVESGTLEETDSKAQSKACTKTGRKSMSVLSLTDQSAVNLAVSSTRADVGFVDSQVAGYVVAQSDGAFITTGQPFNVAPYGIASPKGNGMAPALAAAVSALMNNGTYAKILEKWGVSDGAVGSVTINGSTS